MAAAYLAWRLEQKVVVTPSGCWEWPGGGNGKGYAHIDMKHWDWPERTVSLHRLVYMLCVGPIPDEMCVLHRCDNPPCLRPDHLFLGTNADNIADKVAKGRHRSPRGEKHGMHRLTAEGVMDIRRRAARGESFISIGRDLGFSDSHISAVVKGKVWSHLPFGESPDLILGRE